MRVRILPTAVCLTALLFLAGACGGSSDDDDAAPADDDVSPADDDASPSDDDDDDDDNNDAGDDDNDTALLNGVDCFEDGGGISAQNPICQYHGADFVGRNVQAPDQELLNNFFPDGFTYDLRDTWEDIINGTDLGMNIRAGDVTYYFFGDTHARRTAQGRTGAKFGLPWGYEKGGDTVIDEIAGYAAADPQYDSITPYLVLDDQGQPTLFLNQIERQYLYPNGQPTGTEVPFWVPGGVGQVDDATIYYWYVKYRNNYDCDQTHLAAFDIATRTWRYIAPFAETKFIEVSPIPVSRDDQPAMTTCPLPWAAEHERGFLLYGAGMPVVNTIGYQDADPHPNQPCAVSSTDPDFREGPLYLGYVRLEDLESEQVSQLVYYYAGPDNGCWQQGDVGAAVELALPHEFGEISVRRIPNTNYVMLLNSFQDAAARLWGEQHPGYEHHYISEMTLRVADLSAPWSFTAPKATAGYGYGNFVVENSIKLVPELTVGGQVVADNVLMFIRVLSTWKGANYDPDFNEYGASLIWALTDFDDFEQELSGR